MISNPSCATHDKHIRLSDILILAVFCLLFYSCWLGSYPLFTPDEGRYTEVAREMLASGDFITPHVNGVVFLDKPILYYWLQALALKLFGINEWAARFFPALIGVIGCIITYICGSLLFNRRSGLLSAVILATTPLYFSTAHYADLNLEVAVFISASLLFFITGVQSLDQQKPNRLIFFCAYFSAALAILTKGLIGIVFPCLIAGAWIILQWRFRTLFKIHLLSGLLLIGVLVFPWYYLAQQANPGFFHYFFVVQQFTRFTSGGTFNNVTPLWFYLPIILIGFFPWTIFLIQAIYNASKNIATKNINASTQLYLLLWIVIMLAFFSIPHSKTIGYIVPVFPALALLTGNFIATQWEKPRQVSIYISLGLLLITALLLAGLLLYLPHLHLIPFALPFEWHLTVMAIVFLATALLAFFTLRANTLLRYVTLCVICSVVFLLTLTQGAAYLNQNSAKPLLLTLKAKLYPQDVVINYYNFYQDAPMYLDRKVGIVADWNDPAILQKDNWQREMWYGKSFRSENETLLSEAQFWTLWHSDKHLFVLMNSKYFSRFKQQTKHYYVITRYNDIIAISNRPEH